jgi:hypothetical protein
MHPPVIVAAALAVAALPLAAQSPPPADRVELETSPASAGAPLYRIVPAPGEIDPPRRAVPVAERAPALAVRLPGWVADEAVARESGPDTTAAWVAGIAAVLIYARWTRRESPLRVASRRACKRA